MRFGICMCDGHSDEKQLTIKAAIHSQAAIIHANAWNIYYHINVYTNNKPMVKLDMDITAKFIASITITTTTSINIWRLGYCL